MIPPESASMSITALREGHLLRKGMCMATRSDTSGGDQQSAKRRSRWRIVLVITAICVVVVWAITGVMRLLGYTRPASAENPPIYPGAQQITAEELSVRAGFKGKHFVLRTPDPQEKIYR